VNAFVDPNWPQNERDLVAEYLERGTLVNQYRGLSRCRFCKESNGSAELTDGSFCWPEGLAHYVWSHVVRLPKRFVAHVQASPFHWGNVPRPTFPSAGQRDRAWPRVSPRCSGRRMSRKATTGCTSRSTPHGGFNRQAYRRSLGSPTPERQRGRLRPRTGQASRSIDPGHAASAALLRRSEHRTSAGWHAHYALGRMARRREKYPSIWPLSWYVVEVSVCTR
jgi:hypothetical protein